MAIAIASSPFELGPAIAGQLYTQYTSVILSEAKDLVHIDQLGRDSSLLRRLATAGQALRSE